MGTVITPGKHVLEIVVLLSIIIISFALVNLAAEYYKIHVPVIVEVHCTAVKAEILFRYVEISVTPKIVTLFYVTVIIIMFH